VASRAAAQVYDAGEGDEGDVMASVSVRYIVTMSKPRSRSTAASWIFAR
jgi:hypothetical protein